MASFCAAMKRDLFSLFRFFLLNHIQVFSFNILSLSLEISIQLFFFLFLFSRFMGHLLVSPSTICVDIALNRSCNQSFFAFCLFWGFCSCFFSIFVEFLNCYIYIILNVVK